MEKYLQCISLKHDLSKDKDGNLLADPKHFESLDNF